MNSLSHHTFLNTRPKAQAKELTELLEHEGATVIELPSIEITEILDSRDARKILNESQAADYAIFVSANAVSFAKLHWKKSTSTQIIAIGKGTATALEHAGFVVDLMPADSSSEGLLELPELTHLTTKKIILFCGTDGRKLLAETLLQRGADVKECFCYARRCPDFDISLQLSQLTSCPIHAIISTSTESLNNLYRMLGSEGRPWLLNQQLLVISSRMVELAKELGFKKNPWLAENAHPTSLVNYLSIKLTSA